MVSDAISNLPKNLSVTSNVLDPAENKPSTQITNKETGSSLYIGDTMMDHPFTAQMAPSIIEQSSAILAFPNMNFQADGWDQSGNSGWQINPVSQVRSGLEDTYFFGARHGNKMIAYFQITTAAANALSNLTDFSPFMDFVLGHVANYQGTNLVPKNNGLTISHDLDRGKFYLDYTDYKIQTNGKYALVSLRPVAEIRKDGMITYGPDYQKSPPPSIIKLILDAI